MNLCGSQSGKTVEWWLELKAKHPRPLLRPEQFAWIMRRASTGGRAGVLHRVEQAPVGVLWNLHLPQRWATRPYSGRYVEVVSSPFAAGATMEELTETLLNL